MRHRVHPKKFRAGDLNGQRRRAFQSVVESCNEILATLGQAQNMNYEQVAGGGQAAQFSFNDHTFRLIDFTVDVRKAAEAACTAAEFQFFLQNVLGKNVDWTNQSEEFMVLQAKVGRYFIARKLYPTQGYLSTERKGKPFSARKLV